MPTNDDEDLFITGHLHQTLAELDEDLKGNSHSILYDRTIRAITFS